MNRKIFASVVTVLTGLFLYSSCTKVDSTDLGNDLIPQVDNVHTFETVLDVTTDNFLYPDSTFSTADDLAALGQISNDPEFGATTADIYSGFIPAAFGTHPFLNKDSVKIDSVVLSLTYTGAYGDTNSIQVVDVVELDNSVLSNFNDTLYYKINRAPFLEMGSVRGSKQYAIKDLNDSTFYVDNGVDSIRSNNQLRIRLDTAFARKFVDYDTSAQYKNDSLFHNSFRGLAIKSSAASPTKNGLAYFNLMGANSRLTVYCRVTVNGKVDTISPYFTPYRLQTANLVKRTPGNNFQNYLNNGNPDDDKVFIQSAPGSYATVKIKGLDTFKTVNRVIHRAELIMERVQNPSDDTYAAVPLMFIDAINDAGDSTFTIRNDFVYTGSAPNYYDVANLGGSYVNNKYIFNLSRYFQSAVSKGHRLYKTLRVYAPYRTKPYFEAADGSAIALPTLSVNTPIAFGRVVLGGGSNATQKMKVRIIYSKI
ncbi:MAG: DUF4270 family protein [Pseudobacter sp.]|uniref:DUF4270 family protein n=1 Tax=Pseudobacter sp. TaxID=2045420 RepID=UPI003F7F2747